LSVTKSEIQNLAKIPPFNPLLRTVRCLRFENLVTARHIGHGKRIPTEIREFIMANHKEMSVPEISENVLSKFGILLTFEAVQRWSRRGLD
jgi:hypothetical protein